MYYSIGLEVIINYQAFLFSRPDSLLPPGSNKRVGPPSLARRALLIKRKCTSKMAEK